MRVLRANNGCSSLFEGGEFVVSGGARSEYRGGRIPHIYSSKSTKRTAHINAPSTAGSRGFKVFHM